MNRNIHRHRTVTPQVPADVHTTLSPLRRGTGDPAFQVRTEGIWLAMRDLEHHREPVTLLIRDYQHHSPPQEPETGPIRLDAYSAIPEAAESVLARAELLLGIDDAALAGWNEFDQLLEQPDIKQLLPRWALDARRRNPGLRFPATGSLISQLFTVVLEQKVTHDQARAGWRWLLRNYGELAPGPAPEGMRVPPLAATVRMVPSWAWHQGWVQPALARTMVRVAERATTLERLVEHLPLAELAQRLTVLPGIGNWTIAETLQRTHGAADLVSIGDYHLAHHVGEALTGRRTDDAGMLDLLCPFAGHRQRVVRLLRSGGMRFSRFGPKLAPTDFRDR